MTHAAEIYGFIDKIAPFSQQMSWDNSGMLIGDGNREVRKIALCLDITADTLEKAERIGADLIISHHPVIFSPVSSISGDSVIYRLVSSGMTAICAHTNLDIADGGVNDALAERLGLLNQKKLADDDGVLLGRIGETDREYNPKEFSEMVKIVLSCGAVRCVFGKNNIKKVAVCGGAGADLMHAAKAAGADALVTGEAKHHELIEAHSLGITFIDGGHFCTEHPVVYKLKSLLDEEYKDIETVVLDEEQPTEFI